MKHSFLDRYAYQDTRVHRLDGRVKVVMLAALIFAAATTPVEAGWTLACYGLLEVLILLAARVPLAYVASRSLVMLPFVVLAAASAPFLRGGDVVWSGGVFGVTLRVTDHGLRVAANVIGRAVVSLVALITLASVTPMEQLLGALRRLRAPALLVMLAGFAYRYIFVLVDEALRLKMARDSRAFGRRGMFWHARSLGRMVGSLFVRSFERAERVYAAMLARGYDGSAAPRAGPGLGRADVGVLAGGLLVLGFLRTSELWLPRLL